jgi:hypothetical protein
LFFNLKITSHTVYSLRDGGDSKILEADLASSSPLIMPVTCWLRRFETTFS